jgi:electron transfer flavoprotein beta subunit
LIRTLPSVKILVPFKRVQDPATAMSPTDEGQWMINPFDEIAIEEALRFREQGWVDEVVGITVADADADEQIRTAFAMGLDRAIRVHDTRALDPYAVARILVAIVHREGPDLVLMGKQAIDDDAGQVGQMMAGLLNWPQATFVSKIELEGEPLQAFCTRETDRGLEVVSLDVPAVVTTDLRLNEPRYVSLPGLMKARKRTIDVLSLEEINVQVEPKTTILETRPAATRSAGVRVESVDELLGHLRNDKIIQG